MFQLKRQPHHPERGWVKILARRGGLARKAGGLARCGGWITLYRTDDHELAYDLLWYLINRQCSRLREMARTGTDTAEVSIKTGKTVKKDLLKYER